MFTFPPEKNSFGQLNNNVSCGMPQGSDLGPHDSSCGLNPSSIRHPTVLQCVCARTVSPVVGLVTRHPPRGCKIQADSTWFAGSAHCLCAYLNTHTPFHNLELSQMPHCTAEEGEALGRQLVGCRISGRFRLMAFHCCGKKKQLPSSSVVNFLPANESLLLEGLANHWLAGFHLLGKSGLCFPLWSVTKAASKFV